MSLFRPKNDKKTGTVSPQQKRTQMIPDGGAPVGGHTPSSNSSGPTMAVDQDGIAIQGSESSSSSVFSRPDNSAAKKSPPKVPQTQIVGSAFDMGEKKSNSDSDNPFEEESLSSAKGPVTGWLVVIKGPAKGEPFPIRLGPQVISRDKSTADIHLTDPAITSKGKQAIIHYDPVTRTFALNRGEASPNMYVRREGKISTLHVGTHHLLEAGDEILFGDELSTCVMFMPFCGESFCWKDVKND